MFKLVGLHLQNWQTVLNGLVTLRPFYSLKFMDLDFEILFFICQVKVFRFSGLLNDT